MVQRLRQGEIDLTFTYSHPDMPRVLDSGNFDSRVVATTAFGPFSPTDKNGRAIFQLPGTEDRPLPWLAYAMDSVLARAEGVAVERGGEEMFVNITHQSMGVDMLKRYAVMGKGFGWFPAFTVGAELADGSLVPIGNAEHNIELEIRVYRARGRSRPIIDKIWEAISPA